VWDLLLWVSPDGSVMNATYSKTMTQYINDTSGGLKAELTTNTSGKVEGRVYSLSPLKTMDGPTYTIDVKFSADMIPALSGTALPAGGGDAGKALTTWVAAVTKKDWPGIEAGLSRRSCRCSTEITTRRRRRPMPQPIFSRRGWG
jgi:hypothetical protein